MIKVGLLGCGLMGKEHLDAYKEIKDVKVEVIADKNIQTCQDIDHNNKIKFVNNYSDVIDDPEIDIIDICLPTFLHADVTEQAARKGKHIFCEKPMALDLEQCDRMINVVQKNNVKLMIGHVLRFWSEYVEAKRRIEEGEIGDVLGFSSRRFVSYPKYSESHWLQNTNLSGGAAFDLLIHDIDTINWLFGGEALESIGATGIKSKTGILDYVMAELVFESGKIGFVEGGWLLPQTYPFTMEFHVIGSEGFIKYHSHGLTRRECKNRYDGATILIFKDEEVIKPKIKGENPVARELKYFFDCIKNNHNLIEITPEDAKRSIDWALKIKKAALNHNKFII